MKSVDIYVSNDGTGRELSLDEVEKYAHERDFSRKASLHARLLAEEMLGLVSEITGKFYAYFRVDENDDAYMLCLSAQSEMDAEKHDMLLDVSTTGKNAAVRGIRDKIKNAFEYFWRGYKQSVNSYGMNEYESLMSYGMTSYVPVSGASIWSLSQYRTNVKKDSDGKNYSEEWDELEKSIIANLADDVSVGINGDKVEIIITKKFEQ